MAESDLAFKIKHWKGYVSSLSKEFHIQKISFDQLQRLVL